MLAMRTGQKLEESSKFTVKVLHALYVGGAYGLIVMAVVQVMILVSWIKH
ncbi:MAG: hypothetical protein G8237_07165 [Magnetococcales bacterium]|nr:hypothetical protein [Magnetococcales bacterium]